MFSFFKQTTPTETAPTGKFSVIFKKQESKMGSEGRWSAGLQGSHDTLGLAGITFDWVVPVSLLAVDPDFAGPLRWYVLG